MKVKQTKDKRYFGIDIPLSKLIALKKDAQMLNLTHCKQMAADFIGSQPSYFRGRGMDFEEVRLYQPGDDIRLMDWHVTARRGLPHTKVYREEKERPVLFLVDQTNSMHFGTRVTFKATIAQQATSLLAWACIAKGDRVGGLLFTQNKHKEIRPKAGKQGILPLLKNLLNEHNHQHDNTTQTPQTLTHSLARLRHVVRPGSLVFIISDFAGFTEETELHLSQLRQRCDTTLVFIYDPLEKEPPPANRYTITDGHALFSFDSTDHDFCQNYRARFNRLQEQLRALAIKRRMLLISIATDDCVVTRLQQYLK